MKKIALWLWALLALALASPGWAQTRNIASGATAGEINSIISDAAAGDTLSFAEGTYNLEATIDITKSLTL